MYYSRAIENSTPETENLHVFYTNKALTEISMERFEEAREDAQKAIEINPNYLKAYI